MEVSVCAGRQKPAFALVSRWYNERETMEFNVCLDQFEGPLDLMLHLVKTSRLDLFELNLDILAGQYVAYIHQALSLALDVSSEYLVEFTSLMEYKSRRLLPRSSEQPDDSYQEDPAEQLARRLREYESAKAQSHQLKTLYEQRAMKLDRPASALIETWQRAWQSALPDHLDLAQLSRAMERVWRRYQILQPYETSVEIKELSVEERMQQILVLPVCAKAQPFVFERLLDDVSTLRAAVVTFLALLELVHAGHLGVHVDEEQETIWIQALNTKTQTSTR